MPKQLDATHNISTKLSDHRVFITYSRKDFARVDRLVDQLTSRGINVLIDRAEIYSFEDWRKRIEELIAAADTIIFAMSPDAMGSEAAAKEVELAVRLNKRILPVLLRPVPDNIIPPQLARLQFLVFTDEAKASALDTLVDAILAGAKYGQGAQGDKIFVSYRREQDAHIAGRIVDHLQREFGAGRVFFDVDNVPLGTDFRDYIRVMILKSEALVIVIGRKWASLFRKSPTWMPWSPFRSIDYVRTEIELALEHNVRILPLLIDQATMPNEHALPTKISQICYFQAAPIRAGSDFHTDMERVLNAIRNPPQHAVI
jgi:hypothetical protein